MKKSILLLLSLLALSFNAEAAAQTAPKKDVDFANYYLKEFEAEVKRAQGNANTLFRNKNEALNRIQTLMKAYPEDPAVLALYERARTALPFSVLRICRGYCSSSFRWA